MTNSSTKKDLQRFSFPSLTTGSHGTKEPAGPFQGAYGPGVNQEFRGMGVEPAPAPVPDKKAFTTAELDKIKADSYKEGYDKGLAEGIKEGQGEKLETDKKITIMLADIQARVNNVFGSFDQLLAQKTTEVVGVITAICKKVAGEALKEFPAAKIESVVKSCLHMLLLHDEVNIFVSDKILGTIESKIAGLGEANGFKGKINLKADPALAETDCRIEWLNGQAIHDTEKMWQEVDKLLQNMINK